jgi:hypothetical protein
MDGSLMINAGTFAKIAPYPAHPLVLTGFGLFLVFGLFKAVLKSPKLPKVSELVAGTLLLRLLRHSMGG